MKTSRPSAWRSPAKHCPTTYHFINLSSPFFQRPPALSTLSAVCEFPPNSVTSVSPFPPYPSPNLAYATSSPSPCSPSSYPSICIPSSLFELHAIR